MRRGRRRLKLTWREVASKDLQVLNIDMNLLSNKAGEK